MGLTDVNTQPNSPIPEGGNFGGRPPLERRTDYVWQDDEHYWSG